MKKWKLLHIKTVEYQISDQLTNKTIGVTNIQQTFQYIPSLKPSMDDKSWQNLSIPEKTNKKYLKLLYHIYYFKLIFFSLSFSSKTEITVNDLGRIHKYLQNYKHVKYM